MFFRVQNLGPLRDAEVDLSKDLIVLAGPNNSGKTYLAWSVYGLHRSRPAGNVDLSRWARQLMKSPNRSLDLDKLLTQEGPNLLESIAREYRSKLHLCFAAESASFAAADISLRGVDRRPRTGPTITVTSRTPFGESAFLMHRASSTRVSWGMINKNGFKPSVEELSALTLDQRKEFETSLGMALRRMVSSDLFPQCTLFPAERIAVNIFAKELALKRTELVDEMVDAALDDQGDAPMKLVKRKAGRYPWPIRDSLKIANDLANLSHEESAFAHLADELESAVIGGGIAVSETGEMLFTPRTTTGSHLPMHLTASVVKSLSSLVFYFRHLAQPGDFLIVDEPELNLHPDNQRKITRILAKASRLGFKVMMSTHSDYVLRELNHLIMLSKLPENEAQELGYDPMSALAPERVGVYLFNEQEAHPVPIEETGFSIKTIDDVVNQLNADEQRLYARLSD